MKMMRTTIRPGALQLQGGRVWYWLLAGPSTSFIRRVPDLSLRSVYVHRTRPWRATLDAEATTDQSETLSAIHQVSLFAVSNAPRKTRGSRRGKKASTSEFC